LRPFYELMLNSGLNPDEWWPQIRAAKPGFGVDVTKAGALVDLKAVGIVDPARVTKEAIMNAVSIAATAMTMGALVVDIPEKEAPAPGGGGMPGMGMM
jgi:chaperonin GroEL